LSRESLRKDIEAIGATTYGSYEEAEKAPIEFFYENNKSRSSYEGSYFVSPIRPGTGGEDDPGLFSKFIIVREFPESLTSRYPDNVSHSIRHEAGHAASGHRFKGKEGPLELAVKELEAELWGIKRAGRASKESLHSLSLIANNLGNCYIPWAKKEGRKLGIDKRTMRRVLELGRYSYL